MALIEQRVPHLLGGMSQRPAVQMGRSQLSQADNWLARLTMGLVKRPPFEFVGKLNASITGVGSAGTFSLNRNDSERFRLVIQDGGVKVFDVLNGGAEITVEDRRESGSTYLDAVAGKRYRVATVGDDTYIVNQGVEVQKGAKKSPSQVPFALVNVEQADFSTTYRIVLIPSGEDFTDGQVDRLSTTTGEQSSASARSDITTDAIAEDLKTSPTYSDQWEVTRLGSTLYIKRADGGDFLVNVFDGLGGNGLRLVKGQASVSNQTDGAGVESIADLATVRAPEGVKVLVAGDPSTNRDNFWVEYKTPDNDPTGQEDGTWGKWVETIAPNTLLNIDPGTMPHRLRWKGTQLNEPQRIVRLPPAFHEAAIAGTTDDGGFTLDESDNALSGSPAESVGHSTDTHAEGFRRLIPGSDGSTTQGVTVRFNFDNADAFSAGHLAFAQVSSISGAGVRTVEETFGPQFVFGVGWTGIYTNETIEYTFSDRVWTTSEKVEIRLFYNSETTPASSLERATISVDGWESGDTNAAVRAVVPGGIQIAIPEGGTYRAGMEAIIKLDGGADTFTYTIANGDTADDIASGLAALINADAAYTASATGNDITVTETADVTVDPDFSYGRCTFAADTAVIPPEKFINIHDGFTALNIIANAFTGETIRNLTDGSEATITSNTTDGKFVCDGLAGGVDNTFQEGDLIEIVGTGDYFILEPVLWEPREVGTDETNPFPSFVEATINDVFVFRNRLGFLTGANIVFSESGELENFFRTTTTDVKDGDRIDVSAAQPNTADFQHALIWNRGLFIWSDLVQYEVSGDPVLTPRTIRLDVISRFPNSRTVPPVVSGRRVYFAHQQEGHVRTHEWIPPTDSEPRFQAPDISVEVPTYMPGAPVDMAADYSHGVLAVLCDGDADAVYLYSFAENFGGEQIMGAWQRMTLPPGVTAMQVDFIDGKLGLVYTYDEGVFLDEADFDQPAKGDSDVVAYLDRQATGTDLTVSPNGGNTDVTVPYEIDTDDSEGVLEVYDKASGALIETVARVDRDTITVSGSHVAADIVAGIAWTATAKLAPIYLRGDGDEPATGGRGQVRYIEVEYNRTQDLKVQSTPVGRSAYTSQVQETSLSEGQLRMSIMARGEDTEILLISDDPGDARVASLSYEMFYHNRARRV